MKLVHLPSGSEMDTERVRWVGLGRWWTLSFFRPWHVPEARVTGPPYWWIGSGCLAEVSQVQNAVDGEALTDPEVWASLTDEDGETVAGAVDLPFTLVEDATNGDRWRCVLPGNLDLSVGRKYTLSVTLRADGSARTYALTREARYRN